MSQLLNFFVLIICNILAYIDDLALLLMKYKLKVGCKWDVIKIIENFKSLFI